jgi:hypothetical protein
MLTAFLLTALVGFAAAAPLPTDVDARLHEFLSAEAEAKDAACNKLLEAYTPYLKAGGGSPEVDSAVSAYLGPESLCRLAVNLSLDGVFSRLQETCLARLGTMRLAGYDADLARSAARLYAGFKLEAAAPGHDASEWSVIAKDLDAGWRYFPSSRYADRLERALWKAGDRQGLFAFKAYRFVDDTDGTFFQRAWLWTAWLFLRPGRGFGQEIGIAEQAVKRDVVSRSPPAAGLPVFGGDVFKTADGADLPLSFLDERSPLRGKRAVLVFFQTTCGYCMADIAALSRVLPARGKGPGAPVAAVGVKLPVNLPPPLSSLGPVVEKIHPSFDLVENDSSGIFKAYRVSAVPLLVFFDERGTPLWTATFTGQGRLERKLTWLLDDLSAEPSAAVRPATGSAGSGPVADWYAENAAADADLRDRLNASFAVATHDASSPNGRAMLENRLLSLHEPLWTFPIAIVGGVVLQGRIEIEQGLGGLIARSSP